MPYKKYPLIRLSGIQLESIHDRTSGIGSDAFARPALPGSSISEFFSALPETGAAADLDALISRLRNARQQEAPVILGMDDVAAESGLQPLIIDLMERGWISALALSWNAAVVDFEIALTGRIHCESPKSGGRTVVEEPGLLLNAALKEGRQKNIGCGESIGFFMTQSSFPFSRFSILYSAYRLNIPVTVHPGNGRDYTRLNPHQDGAVLALMGERDFHLLASIICQKGDQGVWIQAGDSSFLAAMMTDVFGVCAANRLEPPCLDVVLLQDTPLRRAERELMEGCRRAGGWGKRISGSVSLLVPLLAAMLLNPAAAKPAPEKDE